MAVVNHFQNPMNFPDPDPDCPKKALDQSQNMAAGSGVVGAGEADLELRKIGGLIWKAGRFSHRSNVTKDPKFVFRVQPSKLSVHIGL